jgi:hypothetical protein
VLVSVGGSSNVVRFSTQGISTVGNVTGNYFIGNGSQLTGITGGVANISGNLAGNLIGNGFGANSFAFVSAIGNVSAGNLIVGNQIIAGTGSGGNISNANVITANVFSAAGNVTGSYILGNGALLTGIAGGITNISGNLSGNLTGNTYGANAFSFVTSTGIISAVGNITTANWVVASSGANIGGTVNAVSVSTTGNVTGGNLRSNGLICAVGNIIYGAANSLTGGTISVVGNITGANIFTSGLVNGGVISANGNITGGNLRTANTVSAGGNVISGNVQTSGLISAGGNITGNIVSATGNIFSSGLICALGNIVGNANVNANNITVTSTLVTGAGAGGNITGANVITANIFSAAGNVIGNNVLVNGIISSAGNITAGAGNFFIGNGSQLTGVVATGIGTLTSLSVTGNIDTGNLRTVGLISAQGNVTANNFVGNGAQLANVLSDRGNDSNDWNTLTQMGVYLVNRLSWAGTTGTPLDSQVFVGMLEVKNASNSSVSQVFYPGTVSTGNAKIQWNRSYWSSSWTSWYKIVNDDQVVEGGVF